MKVEFISLNNLLYKNCLIHRKFITLFIKNSQPSNTVIKNGMVYQESSIYLLHREKNKRLTHTSYLEVGEEGFKFSSQALNRMEPEPESEPLLISNDFISTRLLPRAFFFFVYFYLTRHTNHTVLGLSRYNIIYTLLTYT